MSWLATVALLCQATSGNWAYDYVSKWQRGCQIKLIKCVQANQPVISTTASMDIALANCVLKND